MANVSAFRGAIRSGLVRQHKWRSIVNFPEYAGSNDAVRQASLLARTTTTPASNIGVMDVGWGGRQIPVPGDRTYEEFTVTFIGVNDFNVRDAFERWSEAINGSETNTGLTALDDFMRDIQLDLLDMNDNVTKTYILKDAYPTVVAGMDMDSGSMDSFVEFSVTFRYINLQSNTTR
jgi:hypothetical protein